MTIPVRRAFCLSLSVLLGVMCFPLHAAAAGGRAVAVDQLGYTRAAPKYVFSAQPADSFSVLQIPDGSTVFRGRIDLWKASDAATGRAVYRGDFTSLQASGSYRIVTSNGDSSSAFGISDAVYVPAFRKALKGFYFQRCGMQLWLKYAGVYQHLACHMNDAVFHSTSDSSGLSHNARGGWHDAGDYGKYVVNAGVSAGTLLLAYEMFPSRFAADDLGIPESGNSVPDILDEARYEIEWLLRMQRADGAFWFKVTRTQFEGFLMPQGDTGTRYIYQVSTAATGDAAAVLAKAARLLSPFDQAFAETCLAAARRGWEFLAASPSILPAGGFKNPGDTGTGEYGDGNDSDERLWASAELFEATGEQAYNSYFLSHYLSGSRFSGAMSWQDVRPLALLTYLRSVRATADANAKTSLGQALGAFCASQVTRRNASGYHVVTAAGEYYWGSNSGALNAAVLLLAGFAATGDTTYRNVAADQLHYVLGANGLARSFVTGLGENPPQQPHHRPSASDGVADPIPGLIVGGPNQYRSGDAVLDAIINAGTAPALCYADTVPSYASNEIAINWNAPLVFVTGYFQSAEEARGVGESRTGIPTGYTLDQNYPNPFNPTTTIGYALPNRSHVILSVYSTLGEKVAEPVNRDQDAGYHAIAFDGSKLASGAYYCRIRTHQADGEPRQEFRATRILLLLR